ncbi:ABC transporter ATP-binding protein [Paenalcaligenes hominis]|uniref:ABC transporter ATP-binding protein n=1 Tax=Paenalcaligenes hominis TaxID=643674 RepID=UPI0035258334
MMNSVPLLKAERLSYRYKKQSEKALSDISFSLHAGQIIGLLGSNGSGKSTLIDLIVGLRTPLTGTLIKSKETGLIISWVPQDYAFYPELSCLANLEFFAGMLSLERPKKQQRIEQVILSCQLDEYLHKRARHCSGGVRRRLNLAIALLQQPDVLLLDEPTVGVDPVNRVFLMDQVQKLAKQGAAVLYATHHLDEVASLCTDLLFLEKGKMVVSGSISSLLKPAGLKAPFRTLESLYMFYAKQESTL